MCCAFAKALLSSCINDSKIEQEIASIPLDIELRLFHEAFAEADTTELPRLKNEYSDLFAPGIPDGFWKDKLAGRDTIYDLLEKAVKKRDFDYESMEKDAENVQKHVKFYFPDFSPIDLTTIISEVNYDQQITLTPQQIYLAVDTYLGADNDLYQGISSYKRENLNIEQMPADLGLELAGLFVEPNMNRTFISSMVYHGKLHYLQSLFAPAASGDQLFDTNQEKYEFVVASENQIWRYYVDRELLFSTDPKLISRFITDAPFSKFYLDIDDSTPGGVGRFIGYRIVSAFMENNDVTLDQMLALPADDIFNKSGYAPL